MRWSRAFSLVCVKGPLGPSTLVSPGILVAAQAQKSFKEWETMEAKGLTWN